MYVVVVRGGKKLQVEFVVCHGGVTFLVHGGSVKLKKSWQNCIKSNVDCTPFPESQVPLFRGAFREEINPFAGKKEGEERKGGGLKNVRHP